LHSVAGRTLCVAKLNVFYFVCTVLRHGREVAVIMSTLCVE